MRKDYFWLRIKRRILSNVWVSRVIILALTLGVVSLAGYFIVKNVDFSSTKYFFGLANNFLFSPEDKIKSNNGRINLLILGKSGKDHAGGDLTDTIIFSSIPLKSKDITLVSIPRDIWIPEIRAKINSAYYWGNQKKIGGGTPLAKTIVEDIVGQPINYSVVVDFSGFKSVINAIGGINVVVVNSFVDEKYPIAGRDNDLCDGDKLFKCRYETLTFISGRQYMDGEMALKFVRSRNAQGDEGTDIARSARQQQVIQAIKEKILSRDVLLHPRILKDLIEVVINSLEIDFDYNTAAIIARKILNSANSIKSYSVDQNLLINPPISDKYDKQYVFISKTGDWGQLQQWIISLLN